MLIQLQHERREEEQPKGKGRSQYQQVGNRSKGMEKAEANSKRQKKACKAVVQGKEKEADPKQQEGRCEQPALLLDCPQLLAWQC